MTNNEVSFVESIINHRAHVSKTQDYIAENFNTCSEFVEDETDIPNPYGKPLNVYGECLEKLSMLIDKLTEKLNSFTKGGT